MVNQSNKLDKYFEGLGRRKTAVARVRLYKAVEKKDYSISINDKPYTKYFPQKRDQIRILAPFEALSLAKEFKAPVKVHGGGVKAQADAIRHGISRALLLHDENHKKRLRRVGYLTRDPRMVERKKYGLKKARRSPQWKKR